VAAHRHSVVIGSEVICRWSYESAESMKVDNHIESQMQSVGYDAMRVRRQCSA
jgi:hypothetical protein